MAERERISTGSYDLNKWLHGGYEKGIITMIAGPPGSGKTNFVVIVSCSQAKKKNKVIFVDTEGGFSTERVKQIAGEEHESILKNIFLLSPTKFEEQKKIFVNFLARVKKDNINLIIIDGMAMLYRLELGDAKYEEEKVREVNREMANQMRVLAEISRKQNIPIVITNQVYSEFLPDEEWRKNSEKKVNIVGGDLLQYWSKCIIELKNENGKKRAVLLKHRNLPQKEISFEIKNQGIFKRGIF